MASTFFKDARCQVGLKLIQWFWKRVFSKVVHVFSHIFFVSPLKRDIMRFHLHKLEFHSRVISAKFSWNWPEGSGYKFSMNVYLFCQEKTRIWTNLKIFQIRMLCAKFGWKSSCDSGNKILKFYILWFLLFCYNFPFKKNVSFFKEDSKCHQCIFAMSLFAITGKRCVNYMEQIWIPFTQGYLSWNWYSDS